VRFVAPGRELIDTLDAVRRHDLVAADLPGHGLKAVARHLGIAAPDREYIRGDRIHATYRATRSASGRYATDDVREVAALSRMLGGPAYALAQLVPRRYERLADAGPATGVIDPRSCARTSARGRRSPPRGRATARRTAARRCTSSRRASPAASRRPTSRACTRRSCAPTASGRRATASARCSRSSTTWSSGGSTRRRARGRPRRGPRSATRTTRWRRRSSSW
jgi:hypothetical protein